VLPPLLHHGNGQILQSVSVVVGGILLAVAPPPGVAVAAVGDGYATAGGDDIVAFTAGSGRENHLRITQSYEFIGDTYVVHYRLEDGPPITPGPGCSRPGGEADTVVICDLHESGDFSPHMIVDLGDRGDSIDIRAGEENVVHGGPGDDVLSSGIFGAEDLFGDDGNDVLVGPRAHGGPGNDVVYARGSASGDDGNDTMIGSDRGQTLDGGRGNDLLLGNGGRDFLYGNSGDDELRGGIGDDYLSGGYGRDSLYGNSGNDTLRGGPDRDYLSGGTGTNRLYQ
jgi:serralysin